MKVFCLLFFFFTKEAAAADAAYSDRKLVSNLVAGVPSISASSVRFLLAPGVEAMTATTQQVPA